MTQARRPDGTGGPLSEGERIDDIQFYVSHKADLIIDDIVLYDAAAEGEKRPFPRRVHFTGWFDSGKQGKEWPGTFDIAADKGAFWHAAKAVPDKEGAPWIRLHLRGRRSLAATTHLSFRHHLSGGDRLRVRLVDTKSGKSEVVEKKGLSKDAWRSVIVEFADMKEADEIHILADKGADLLVDDVLLYEPGK
jgi:hypothetical protein